MSDTGFRINRNTVVVDDKMIIAFQGQAVANVGDAMGRFQIMDAGIKTINKPGVKMVGSAVTIRVRPGDNLMVHAALEVAVEGDVLVVDAQRSVMNASWGEILTHIAMKKNIAGLVVDGAVRDAYEIKELGFPVFTRAVNAAGPDKEGPGEINYPINCGGVPVSPGDIVLGDDDGVAVIPRNDAAVILQQLQEILVNEKRKIASILQGEYDSSWINKVLKEKGCLGVE